MSLNLNKSGWKRVALGDISFASKEKVAPSSSEVDRYVAGEHMDSDDLKIRRWGEVGDGYLGPAFHRRFRAGQVLYGSRRTYLRKVAVAEFDGVTANTTFVVETKDPSILLQEFLPFVMNSEPFHAFAVRESKGSVNPYVNWSDIARYEFDLPPCDVQKRLADSLWAVEQYRLDLQARNDRTRAVIARRIASWWKSETLNRIGDIGECITGSTPSKSVSAYWDSDDVPFFTPSEVVEDTVTQPRQWVSRAGANAGRLLPKSAVAVACIGGDMGRSAVLAQAGISNQQITSIVGLDHDDAYLLQAILSHPMGRAAMEARETTTIVRKLNKSDLMEVKVPWPLERDQMRTLIQVQREVVAVAAAELSTVRTLERALSSDIFGGAA